jgi:hypothetical protein
MQLWVATGMGAPRTHTAPAPICSQPLVHLGSARRHVTPSPLLPHPYYPLLALSTPSPPLLQSLVLLLAEDAPAEELQTTWRALEAVCSSIPKEALPEYVHCLKVRQA